MPRVVVLTADVLAAGVAGPAIRALAIADALAAEVYPDGEPRHRVRLLSTASCDLSGRAYDVAHVPSSRLRAAVGDAEVLIVQGLATYDHPWLLRTEAVLVVDLYDPVLLEQLEQMTDRPLVARRATHDQTVRTVNDALVRGDFFLCASEGQRLFWLGQLAALGRFDPLGYDRDPSLRALIDVVPFGLPSHPPLHRAPVVKGVLPGIGPDDRLVLWAGGVYNWLDPLTLIAAMALLRDRRPDLRLLFLGMKHPNPDTPSMRVAWRPGAAPTPWV